MNNMVKQFCWKFSWNSFPCSVSSLEYFDLVSANVWRWFIVCWLSHTLFKEIIWIMSSVSKQGTIIWFRMKYEKAVISEHACFYILRWIWTLDYLSKPFSIQSFSSEMEMVREMRISYLQHKLVTFFKRNDSHFCEIVDPI